MVLLSSIIQLPTNNLLFPIPNQQEWPCYATFSNDGVGGAFVWLMLIGLLLGGADRGWGDVWILKREKGGIPRRFPNSARQMNSRWCHPDAMGFVHLEPRT